MNANEIKPGPFLTATVTLVILFVLTAVPAAAAEKPVVLDSFAVDGMLPCGLASDGDSLWYVDPVTTTLYQYDTSGTKIKEFGIHENNTAPSGLVFIGGFLWISDTSSSALVKYITPSRMLKSFETPDAFKPSAVAFDHTFVWIADNEEGKFYKCKMVGARGLVTKAKASTKNNLVGGATFNGDYIWFVSPDDNGIFQINVDARNLARRFEGPWEEGSGITFLDDACWVLDRKDKRIYKLDIKPAGRKDPIFRWAEEPR